MLDHPINPLTTRKNVQISFKSQRGGMLRISGGKHLAILESS